MSIIEVTKRIDFSCCYVMQEKDNPQLEAHRYRFEATVTGPDNYEKTGRVIWFDDFRRLCQSSVPNKSFLYCALPESVDTDIAKSFKQYGIPTVGYQFELSTERILNEISLNIVNKLNLSYPGVILKETKLREDGNSFVTWTNVRSN